MIFGFSGTQNGGTPQQLVTLRHLFNVAPLSVLHHGDCVGSDAQAHRLAWQLDARIIIHPPNDDRKRAFCRCADEVLAPHPYLVRNRDIVIAARDGVIAMPMGTIEQYRGSGTWATIRYARKAKRSLWIIWPDGTFTTEHGD